MRTALCLGLAAAALGSAVLAPAASASHHCPVWAGSDHGLPVWMVAVCTTNARLVWVGQHPAGQGVAACTTGAEPHEIWINGQRWFGVVDIPNKCTGVGIG